MIQRLILHWYALGTRKTDFICSRELKLTRTIGLLWNVIFWKYTHVTFLQLKVVSILPTTYIDSSYETTYLVPINLTCTCALPWSLICKWLDLNNWSKRDVGDKWITTDKKITFVFGGICWFCITSQHLQTCQESYKLYSKART